MDKIQSFESWLSEALLFLKQVKQTPLYPHRIDGIGRKLTVEQNNKYIDDARTGGFIETDSGIEAQSNENENATQIIPHYRITERGEDYLASILVDQLFKGLDEAANNLKQPPVNSGLKAVDNTHFVLEHTQTALHTETGREVSLYLADIEQAERIFKIISKRLNKDVTFERSHMIPGSQPVLNATILRKFQSI